MLTVLPFHVPLYVQSMETKNNILDVTISKIGLNHFYYYYYYYHYYYY